VRVNDAAILSSENTDIRRREKGGAKEDNSSLVSPVLLFLLRQVTQCDSELR